MSYALERSKRKFETILDAISDELGSGSKKRRLPAISINRRPISKLLTVKPLTQKSPSASTSKSSTFNPFDREQFRRRLLTYRSDITLWSSKAELIGEVKWAARGWELVGKNKMECKACSKHTLIDMDAVEVDFEEEEEEQEHRRTEAEASLITHYEAQIVHGHDEDCPWRQRGCDASLYRVRFNGFNAAIKSLRERFESLMEVGTNMPSDVQCSGDMDTKRIFGRFCARAYSSRVAVGPPGAEGDGISGAPPFNDASSAAFTLALHGWERVVGSKDPKNVVVRCDACFARVGLWMYEHVDDGQLLTGGGLQPTLYAHELHYDDCPWINAATQQSGLRAESNAKESKSASGILTTFLDGTGEMANKGVGSEAESDMASLDGDARDNADKQRFKKVRELTRTFHMSKARKAT